MVIFQKFRLTFTNDYSNNSLHYPINMKKIFTIVFAVFCTFYAIAQEIPTEPVPFILGQTETIYSQVLSETRTINVYLPEGYAKEKAATYPVIYLMDGSANEDFIHISGLVQFLTMGELMPKTIVVGIANVDRKRDFTFPTTIEKDKKDFPTTGGSAKFIGFLEKELQPYIQQNYRTSNSKTIIGQSLGGLLATEILLTKPNLFNTYIIVSPSLWWNDESLLADLPRYSKTLAEKDLKICIAVGTEGKIMERDAKNLYESLKKINGKNLKTDFLFMPEENHATILHSSIYKSLLSLNPKK